MKVKFNRCKRCGTKYLYQESGGGARSFNDPTYCHSCAEVVDTALKAVPIKFIINHTDCPDVTLEDIAQIKMSMELDLELSRPGLKLPLFVQRMCGGVANEDGVLPTTSKYGDYWVRHWWGTGKYSIFKEIWVDAATGLDEDGNPAVTPTVRHAPESPFTGAYVNQPHMMMSMQKSTGPQLALKAGVYDVKDSPMGEPTGRLFARKMNYNKIVPIEDVDNG